MNKYEFIGQIGDGTFGAVLKGVHKATGEIVAIKRMKQKYVTWDECVRLPEVVALRKVHNHPNIIRLREVIRESQQLFFIFDFMDGDLLALIKQYRASGGIPPPRVKSYLYQILQSLAHVHKAGYFHRDMKPENVLFRRDGPDREMLKLADFGLVKEIRARPPFTDYVSTRWYRAPELLLQDRAYNSPVDIFAAGCMVVEMFTGRPLFPGTNESDQLFKTMSVLGVPTEEAWPEAMRLAKNLRYTFPALTPTPLAKLYPNIPKPALDLISRMLVLNPKHRITAAQALQHPYFRIGPEDEVPSIPQSLLPKVPGAPFSAPSQHVTVAGVPAPPSKPEKVLGPSSAGGERLPPAVPITKATQHNTDLPSVASKLPTVTALPPLQTGLSSARPSIVKTTSTPTLPPAMGAKPAGLGSVSLPQARKPTPVADSTLDSLLKELDLPSAVVQPRASKAPGGDDATPSSRAPGVPSTESPLAKLLGSARYRSGGPTTTFSSPSFAASAKSPSIATMGLKS
jgi:serine/threonine protein kinase